MPSNHPLLRRAGAAVVCLTAAGLIAAAANGPKFFPDDPILVDNDRAIDASKAAEREDSDYYDFAENTFFDRGDPRGIPAVNINTLGEVPDSSWFENRLGRRPMSLDEVVKGPDTLPTLSVEGWPIVAGKNEGLQPGWRVKDPVSGQLYQIEFDPPTNPEMATGAEMIGTAFYHTLGYNVVDVYLVEVDDETLTIAPDAMLKDINGKNRRVNKTDIDWVLNRAARGPNGKYRALASRFASGRPLGSFRYFGTKTDDPNDIFPHEHRRELRGNRVFAAWLNHDDSRGLNSLAMLEGPEGQRSVKHYMFDFGSIMGSGTAFPQTERAGNEYMYEPGPGWKTLFTLGTYVRPWLKIDYPDVPDSVGRFEADAFDPLQWRPEYPNVAFGNMQPEDAFWAARILSNMTDDMIQAVVRKARYSDARANDYIVGTLIKRRDKALKAWLPGVNPLVEARLSPEGVLTFENAAVTARVATPPENYIVSWSSFDNAAATHQRVGEDVTVTEMRAQAPASLLSGQQYVAASVRATHPEYPDWNKPVVMYFRRDGQGWKTVGLERGAEVDRKPYEPPPAKK